MYKAFGENYAAYYIYYMLNYNTQKKVNTVTADNKKTVCQQYDTVMTWYQAKELDEVNKYREGVDSELAKFDSELAAFANYRGYLNAHDGFKEHDWLRDNFGNGEGVAGRMLDKITVDGYKFAENTIEFSGGSYGDPKRIAAPFYYESKSHYETMVKPSYIYIGISNINWGTFTETYSRHEYKRFSSSQFDVYLNSKIDTALYPAK